MGLSHALQISGILNARKEPFRFCIVESGFISRLVARALLSEFDVSIYKSLDDISGLEGEFDVAVDATPPFQRSKNISVLSRVSSVYLIEKPVLAKVTGAGMSGYVLQHNPLVSNLRQELNGKVKNVSVYLNTNLKFESDSTWRGGQFGGVLNEFMGHVLSVIMAVDSTIECAKVVSVESAENKITILIQAGDRKLTLFFNYAIDEVRKTSYTWEFDSIDDVSYTYDNYSIVRGEQIISSLPLLGATCEYYLRGFDFCNQMTNLVDGKGDIFSNAQLNLIESLIKSARCYND